MVDRMGLSLTVEGLAEYENAVGKVKKLNDGVAQSMQDVEQTSGPAQMGAKKLATAFAIGNIAAQAAVKAFSAVAGMAKKLIVGSTMLAARVNVLGTVLEGVGERAGYTAAQMEELEEAVKSQGITTQAARQSLIMMAQANVDLAYATDLSRVAQNAAVVAGTNSSDAFQRLIYGMSRGRTQVLATMGIIVNFTKAEEELAKSLNTTRKELEPAQRMQARYAAVLKASEAIQDAYTDAMQDAGKQMTSLPRYLEEIQLALGQAFQPAFTTLIFDLKERLGELLEYLQDPATKQALDDFSVALDRFLKLMIKAADTAAEDVPKIVEFFTKIAVGIADITQETSIAEQTVANLWTALRQFAAWWWGALAAGAAGLKQLIIIGAEIVDSFLPVAATFALLKGEIDWAGWVEATDAAFKDVADAVEDFEDTVKEAGNEAMLAASRFLGVVEELPRGLGAAADSLDVLANKARTTRGAVEELADATTELSEDMIKATEALVNLRLRLQREYADRLIKQERDTIKREIKLAREREDLARRNAEAIADAYRRAEEARADFQEDSAERWTDLERDAARDREKLDLDYARTRIDIEKATRRRLEDIQRDFEFSLLDAARTRDAFALVMAQRRAAREREEALKGRDRQLGDAKTDYEQQRADLQRSLAEQRADLQISLAKRQQDIERQLQESLIAIEAQRQQDLVDLERRNQREREMTALQTAWAEEDRQRRLARQLEDIERQHGVLLNVTAEGLTAQVEEWAAVYGPEGAATTIVRTFADTVVQEAQRIQNALIDAAYHIHEMRRLGLPVDMGLPPELTFSSPKLRLQVGIEKLQSYLKTKPLSVMPGGAMPTTQSSSTFSRSETFAKTQSSHSVDVNMPDMDVVVARQMKNVFRQVLAA